jgi:hypothetical protein
VSDESGYAVRLADGGEARAVALELQAEVLHLVTDRAFPPGRPLAFDLVVQDEALALQAKAVGSKRREDGRYDVKVRLHTLRRDQRARLAALSWT